MGNSVEISDIVNSTRLKFNDAASNISRLFVICSEILSRAHEHTKGPCPLSSNKELVEEFNYIEGKIHAISRLRNLTSSSFTKFARTSKLFILINFTSGSKEGQFEAMGFFDNNSAVKRYSQLEAELQDQADVVLVGASQQDAIKLAYTNYFSDASQFLINLDTGLESLKGT